MKTINDTLFVEVPTIYENFKIVQYARAGTYLMETDSTSLNHWKINIPLGEYEIIGFVELEDKENFALKKIN